VLHARIVDLALDKVRNFALQQMGDATRAIGFLMHERSRSIG